MKLEEEQKSFKEITLEEFLNLIKFLIYQGAFEDRKLPFEMIFSEIKILFHCIWN